MWTADFCLCVAVFRGNTSFCEVWTVWTALPVSYESSLFTIRLPRPQSPATLPALRPLQHAVYLPGGALAEVALFPLQQLAPDLRRADFFARDEGLRVYRYAPLTVITTASSDGGHKRRWRRITPTPGDPPVGTRYIASVPANRESHLERRPRLPLYTSSTTAHMPPLAQKPQRCYNCPNN